MSTSKYDDAALKLYVKELIHEMRDEIRENLVDEMDKKLNSQKSDINDRLQRLEDSKEVMEEKMEFFSYNLHLLEKNASEADMRMDKENLSELEDPDLEFIGKHESSSIKTRRFTKNLRNLKRSLEQGRNNSAIIEDEIEEDVFGIMMLTPSFSKTWFLGLMSFVFQCTLGSMVIWDQCKTSFGETPCNIPAKSNTAVKITQFIVIILAIMTQTDVLVGVRMILIFPLQNKNSWNELISCETNIIGEKLKNRYWYLNILLPNMLKILEGSLILASTYIVILQSDDVVNLLKDYSALFVISSIDNVLFDLADEGYFGKKFSYATAQVKEKKLKHYKKDVKWSLISVFLVILLSLIIPWAYQTTLQYNGKYMEDDWPICPMEKKDTDKITYFRNWMMNDKCDFPLEKGTNIQDCNWDGGACVEFNEKYPNCKVKDLSKLGNKECDTEEMYNSVNCGFDKGDCTDHNKKIYENKGVSNDCKAFFPDKLGDDNCDHENDNPECDYDAGDCRVDNYPACEHLPFPNLIGNGRCDGGKYNTPECGFDGGDCVWFNDKYRSCRVDDIYRIDDGRCDGGEYNVEECGWDGGDCVVLGYPNCHAVCPKCVGDEKCHLAYNTSECEWDGGDCV